MAGHSRRQPPRAQESRKRDSNDVPLAKPILKIDKRNRRREEEQVSRSREGTKDNKNLAKAGVVCDEDKL
jgi:hypothetical protein